MNKDLMWKGVVDCNTAYDGKYFYGVKTTGIFCRPSCKSRMPKKDNVMYFYKGQDAISKGFRPCKRCRPDLLIYEPNQEIAENLKERLAQVYQWDVQIKEVLEGFNFSKHRLIQIFKENYGMTIRQFITQCRIEEAMRQLQLTNKRIVDIALDVGFNSNSAFYSAFNQYVKMSPSEYKNKITCLKE